MTEEAKVTEKRRSVLETDSSCSIENALQLVGLLLGSGQPTVTIAAALLAWLVTNA